MATSDCPKSSLAMQEAALPSHPCSVGSHRSHDEPRPTSVQPRPIPPTPRKMMSNVTGVPSPTMYSREHRRSSSIPRPTSGTSRRATPADIEIGLGTSGLIARGWPCHAPARPRWSDHEDSTNARPNYPPASFNTQRANLPRSDSLQSVNQRCAHAGSLGTRQQLPTRNHSATTLGTQDGVSSMEGTAMASASATSSRLPKSMTSTSLAPKDRDVIPGRRLLRPLEPPMPRSQTIGNLSCFTGAGLETAVSPAKAPRKVSGESTQETQAGVFGALKERRMIKPAMEIVCQGEKEATATSQASTGGGTLACMYRGPEATKSRKPSDAKAPGESIHLSSNDFANRDRLEARRGLQPASKLDSTTDGARLEFRKTSSPPGAIVSEISADGVLKHPPSPTRKPEGHLARSVLGSVHKRVLLPEEIDGPLEAGTWLGRYSVIYDQLRTNDAPNVDSNFFQNSSLPCRLKFNMRQNDARLDEAEARRKMDTLFHLKGLCKNADALGSFQEFESQLHPNQRDTDHKAGCSRSLPSRDQSDGLNSVLSTLNTARNLTGRSLLPKKIFFFPSSSSSSGTSSESQLRSGLPSSQSIWGLGPQITDDLTKPGLVKSETTGSLVALNRRGSESVWKNSILKREKGQCNEVAADGSPHSVSTSYTAEVSHARVAQEVEVRHNFSDNTSNGIAQAVSHDIFAYESDSASAKTYLKPANAGDRTERETLLGRATIRAGDLLDVPPAHRVLMAKMPTAEIDRIPRTEGARQAMEQNLSVDPGSRSATKRFVPTPFDPEYRMGYPSMHRHETITADAESELTGSEATAAAPPPPPPPPATYRRADDPPRVSGIPRVAKSIRERKRSGRQSSGEILKDVAMDIVKGAGKGVRKMARSFTGKSEVEAMTEPEDEGSASASARKVSGETR